MIEVQNLTKRYGNFEAVKNISFTVNEGMILGLLGPNGAGKTTLLRALSAYHLPSEGSIHIHGINVLEEPLNAKALIGYLPEAVPLYGDMTVLEYMRFIADARNIPRPSKKNAVETSALACGIENVLNKKIETLSKGYKQRVGIAQAIVHDPPVLILDEPTTGLDPNQISEIRELIRTLGTRKTLILSTHILREAEAVCSDVLILNKGEIAAQGSAASIASGLAADETIVCAVKGSAERLQTVSEPVSAAIAASEWNKAEARLTVRARAGEGDAASEAVFDWAVSNGIKIMELRRENISMEAVFARLTKE